MHLKYIESIVSGMFELFLRCVVVSSGTQGLSADGNLLSHKVLVCTDLAARGLDIPGRVDHIINFDFPHTSIDYLHRSGRTARAGNPGKVTSLLSSKDRVLAHRIEWALKHKQPLDSLSANKRVVPSSMR